MRRSATRRPGGSLPSARGGIRLDQPIDGALTEYVVLPADHSYDVPDRMSTSAAALVEPPSVAL
jgi:threonine dehydrogenase-like Zn-dependent dehydrogenase